MTNEKWQFVVRTSDFYLSLVIFHLAEKSLPWLRSIFALVVQMNTDLCSSVVFLFALVT